MACCENTYNLGCFDSCAVVTLPILFPSDGQYTLFFNGTNNIKYKVVGVSGEPFIVDATLLNSDSTYTFYVVNNSGVRVVFDIDGVDYDCFKIKIETYFNIDATEDITPTQPCTLMCQETYDPMHESKDIFDYNNLRVKAVADGTTITGDGTAGNPFVAVDGGGIDSVQAGTNIIIDNSDPSNPIINATLSAYQPIDATLTALAGLLTGANKIPYSTGTDTFSQLDLDTDGTLNANSDIKIATQKAVKTYMDNSGIVDADFTLINTFRSLYNY